MSCNRKVSGNHQSLSGEIRAAIRRPYGAEQLLRATEIRSAARVERAVEFACERRGERRKREQRAPAGAAVAARAKGTGTTRARAAAGPRQQRLAEQRDAPREQVDEWKQEACGRSNEHTLAGGIAQVLRACGAGNANTARTASG